MQNLIQEAMAIPIGSDGFAVFALLAWRAGADLEPKCTGQLFWYQH